MPESKIASGVPREGRGKKSDLKRKGTAFCHTGVRGVPWLEKIRFIPKLQGEKEKKRYYYRSCG